MSDRGSVQAECPTCGGVIAKASSLTCGISGAEEAALCELPCPQCERLLLIPMAPIAVTTLLLLGAHKADQLPFELLEDHSGPAVSWDELLDAHLELAAQSFPQRELTRDEAA